MLIWGIIFLVLTWVTFAKLSSPAMIIAWLFSALGLLGNLLGFINDGFLFVSFVFMIIVMSITAIITGGDWH